MTPAHEESALSDDSRNDKVTLALIQRTLADIGADVKDVKIQVNDLHVAGARQDELNKVVKHQLWTPDGKARMQCTEDTATNAMVWVRVALVPIALAMALGVIAMLVK